jgi:hypothetical protein
MAEHKYSGVKSFHAGKDGRLLRVIMDDPENTVVWVDSEDAWKAYGRGVPMKPMCVFDPPTFKLIFEDGVTMTWAAELGTAEDGNDKLLYNLKRQTEN